MRHSLRVCLLTALPASADLLWPRDNFVRSLWPTSLVVGTTLYIDGGEVYSDSGVNPLGSTQAIDLSKSWTNTSITASAVDKPSSFPFARQPWTWALDNGQLQFLGGWVYGGFYTQAWFSQQGAYASIDGNSNQTLWTQSQFSYSQSAVQPPSSGDNQIGIGAGYLQASGNGSAYALGGAFIPNVQGNVISGFTGMAVQDLQTGAWSNVSSTGYGANGYGAFGQAIFTETYGNQGILIFLGGYSPYAESFTWDSPDPAAVSTLQEMGRIVIYDIDSQTFTEQPATGTVPGSRWAFCGVGAEDANGDGYDIFIHGGFYSTQAPADYEPGYDNIYVLSLPSFQWFELSNTEQEMRAGHTCQALPGGQMVVIGGDNPNTTGAGATTDPWPNAINIFNMSGLAWSKSYEATAPDYVRSSNLASMIGSNVYPTSGASQLGLDLFTDDGSGGGGSSGGSGAGGSGSGSGSGTPVGAIAGGVVGGVVLIAAVAAIAFFCVFRRQKANRGKYVRSPSEEETAYKAELDGTSMGPRDDKKLGALADTDERANSPVELDHLTPPAELDSSTKPSELASTHHPETARPHSRRSDVYELQG